MPTARQLLEQADALMRRNRRRGRGKDGGPPTLTDALDIGRTSLLAPTIVLPVPAATAADPIPLDTLSDLPVLTDVVDQWPGSAAQAEPVAGAPPVDDALGDALEADALATAPAEWTGRETEAFAAPAAPRDDALHPFDGDATEAIGTAAAADPPDAGAIANSGAVTGEGDRVNATMETVADADDLHVREATAGREAASVAGRSVDGQSADWRSPQSDATAGATGASLLHDEEFILDIPPSTDSAPHAAEVTSDAELPPPPAVASLGPGTVEWDAMAEEIRMQVLQRLDLFTDTGMRDQLGARLEPIVARASAELVATLNQALGELVRGYVAEAIEREIESWRKRGV
ncbi:MAG: hypothetical protein ABI533_03470 [Betaproteobacteria bacterium]